MKLSHCWRVFLVVLMAAALFFVACGDDDEGSENSGDDGSNGDATLATSSQIDELREKICERTHECVGIQSDDPIGDCVSDAEEQGTYDGITLECFEETDAYYDCLNDVDCDDTSLGGCSAATMNSVCD